MNMEQMVEKGYAYLSNLGHTCIESPIYVTVTPA